jgi:serine/alanine adding enzyme
VTRDECDQNLKIVNTLDEKLWRQFVDQHPQGNVFHTPEMFQVFARTKGHQPSLWAAVNDRGHVLALFLPVLMTLSDGLLRRMTTRAIAYGSVLCAPESEGPTALAALLKAYVKKARCQALFTELRHLSDLSSTQPVLTASGFSFEDHLNYQIDLNRPIEAVWRGISKSGRKAIRRSKSRGVVPEEVPDRSLIPLYYGFLRQTYARAKVPLADISLFEAVFDILVPKGMAKMLLARVDDRYAAASLEIPYKDVIYSWYSGYDRAFRIVYPNDRLVWHILEWGAKNGYRCFDFGGAGRPDEPYGARDFKAKFGGRLVNFGRHTCVHAPFALALSRIGYQVYREMMRYLPAGKGESS